MMDFSKADELAKKWAEYHDMGLSDEAIEIILRDVLYPVVKVSSEYDLTQE